MNRFKSVASVFTAAASLALLSACATIDTAPNGQQNLRLAKEDPEMLTGSRIPAKSLPREVKQVNGQEMARERAPNPGPPVY